MTDNARGVIIIFSESVANSKSSVPRSSHQEIEPVDQPITTDLLEDTGMHSMMVEELDLNLSANNKQSTADIEM